MCLLILTIIIHFYLKNKLKIIDNLKNNLAQKINFYESGNRIRKMLYRRAIKSSEGEWRLIEDKVYIHPATGEEYAVYNFGNIDYYNIYAGSELVGKKKINPDGKESSSTIYYYFKDHLGNIRAVMDGASGTITQAQDYDAWGDICRTYTSAIDTTVNKFTGKERDQETGYDYFGARYYDSRIGRWLSVDLLMNKYIFISPYSYTLNNPLIFTDPTGLWIPKYDSETKTIKVWAEKDDNLQDLYSQIGLKKEEFAKKYNINDINGYKITADVTNFDITDFVTPNRNYNSNACGMANCFAFVLDATGLDIPKEIEVPNIGIVPAEESLFIDKNFNNTLQSIYGLSPTDKDIVGNITVFTGNFYGEPNVSIHAALYIITSSTGEKYYISRNGPGEAVTLNSESDYRRIYRFSESPTEIYKINSYR